MDGFGVVAIALLCFVVVVIFDCVCCVKVVVSSVACFMVLLCLILVFAC